MIEVDLPGVAPERVEVRGAGSRVTIHGTRDTLTSGLSPTGKTLLLERRHGQFSRTIEMEYPVDADRKLCSTMRERFKLFSYIVAP